MGMLISLIMFEEIADDVFMDPLEGDYESEYFDKAISQQVSKLQSPRLTQMMIDITALGSMSVIFVLLIIFISILYTYRDLRGLIYIGIVATGAGVWPLILKQIFERPRPAIEQHLVFVSDLSFPSGHAFGSTSIYIALAFYAAKYARSWQHELFFYGLGTFLIILVGVSRIYLGVHYPTDVLAGIAGGTFWASLVSAIVSFMSIRGSDSHAALS